MKRSLLSKEERELFKKGRWYSCFEKLGAHLGNEKGVDGCNFAVWAPGA